MLLAVFLTIFAEDTANLLTIVKSLLRYIALVVLAAVTLTCGIEDTHPCSSSNPHESLSTEISTCYIDVTHDANLCLSHQVPSSQVLRLKKNTSNKHFFGFVKVSKKPNTNFGNFIQRESLIIHAPFIKPAHKLIRLGKLVI